MSAGLPAKEVRAWPAWKVSTKARTWQDMTTTMQEAFLTVCRARRGCSASKMQPRTLGALKQRGLVMPLSDGSLIPTYPGLELWAYVRHWKGEKDRR